MAIYWTAKPVGAVYRYTWQPPLAEGDSLTSYTVSVTGAVIDAQELGTDSVALYVSGGTAGATAVFTLTAVSDQAEEFDETVYLPVTASTAQIADTARDYVNFALRKITGIGSDPSAAELADALERLNGLVARWRAGGADIGATMPIEAATVIYCPDWAASALRYNLLIECADLYQSPMTPFEVEQARRGLQLVKHKSLPSDRSGDEFF